MSEPAQLTEPTTSLVYLARAIAAKYAVPVRVTARGDSGGAIGLEVHTWVGGAWVLKADGLDDINELTSPPTGAPS